MQKTMMELIGNLTVLDDGNSLPKLGTVLRQSIDNCKVATMLDLEPDILQRELLMLKTRLALTVTMCDDAIDRCSDIIENNERGDHDLQ